MELNLALNLVRQIVRSTTNAEVTIKTDKASNVWQMILPLDDAEMDYLTEIERVLRHRELKIWFEDGQIFIEDLKEEEG